MICEKTLRLLSFPLPSAVCSLLEGLLKEHMWYEVHLHGIHNLTGERDLMGMKCHEKNLAWLCITDNMWKRSGGGWLWVLQGSQEGFPGRLALLDRKGFLGHRGSEHLFKARSQQESSHTSTYPQMPENSIDLRMRLSLLRHQKEGAQQNLGSWSSRITT